VPEPSACFETDGELYRATPLANGPWEVGALHGGPVGALFAHLCESFDTGAPAPLRLARLAVDLLRPVPMTPLRPEVRVARPGRKVDWLDASLWAGDVQVARASALRLAGRPLTAPEGADPWASGAAGDLTFAGTPEEGEGWARGGDSFVPGFHNLGVDLRFVRGRPDLPGPGQLWGRLLHPIVAGVADSPFMRAMAIADFGNALSSMAPPEAISFINPDLLVSLWRAPVGEWIGLDAVTRADLATGTGLAEMALRDADGPIGRAEQSILLENRA
jgi:hypothetical protein